MSLCAFFSDYLVVSTPLFANRRRAFALDLLFIYVYATACIGIGLWWPRYTMTASLIAVLLAGKVIILEYSARAATREDWACRHSLWHCYILSLSWLTHVLLSEEHRHHAWDMESALSMSCVAAVCEIVIQLMATLWALLHDTTQMMVIDTESAAPRPIRQWLSEWYRECLLSMMALSIVIALVSTQEPFRHLDAMVALRVHFKTLLLTCPAQWITGAFLES